ncbi:hypothetical protein G647_09860 [Cladophialophora carrionii CBS 160.54]|uniref:Tachykinin family protein n=1 Tax=Cladophialophora carrionii CBS 160.54 TaxID=1279043 RepID=V9DMI9_9EURO|nr:uncharacterized protein G647_09860 [Cladophialophora carrionii CBS 160.54]ETI27177.1 hypothetical protein G647_09860 [Cladophialophora carrionii CBS 160.54]
MSPAKKADKIVFINVPGDKNALSQRDRELQAAAARAHAARVSRRPPQKSGIVKHEPGGHPGITLSALLGSPSAVAIRPSRGKAKRWPKVLEEAGEDYDTLLNKRRIYAVSASSLGQGQVDPFDSAPVKGLDNFIYSILDFAYDYAFPSFVPAAPTKALPTHRANRRRLGRQFGFLLEAQIVAAAKFQLSPMISLTEQNRRRVQAINEVHEKRAVNLLDQELRRLGTTPSDTVIYASALLAYVSGPSYDRTSTRHPKSPLATAQNLHAMGHLDIIPERVQGVRTLVQRRGGIDALSMPFQRIVLTYLDTIVSTRLGVRPGWTWPAAVPESLRHTGEHILDQTAAQLMQVMGSGFSELQHEQMRQTLFLMCEATAALDHCHRGGPSPPSIWDVARIRLAVQHRLCSFDPLTPEQISLADLQFELCRLSALIYSDLVLFPIPEQSDVKPPLFYDLGRTLDKYESVAEPSQIDRDFLAWCVLLAAAASISYPVFRTQFIQRLEGLVGSDERLRDWEFYEGVVKRYLWWGYLLDPPAKEAFAAISWPDTVTNGVGLSLDRQQGRHIKQPYRCDSPGG